MSLTEIEGATCRTSLPMVDLFTRAEVLDASVRARGWRLQLKLRAAEEEVFQASNFHVSIDRCINCVSSVTVEYDTSGHMYAHVNGHML
jgi:hypothetical protein